MRRSQIWYVILLCASFMQCIKKHSQTHTHYRYTYFHRIFVIYFSFLSVYRALARQYECPLAKREIVYMASIPCMLKHMWVERSGKFMFLLHKRRIYYRSESMAAKCSFRSTAHHICKCVQLRKFVVFFCRTENDNNNSEKVELLVLYIYDNDDKSHNSELRHSNE